MTEKIAIKHDELEQAINDCYEHIRNLFMSSKILYEQEKFDISVFLNVLIFEEINKYYAYIEALRQNRNLYESDFKNLTCHRKKLVILISKEIDVYKEKLNEYDPNKFNKKAVEKDISETEVELKTFFRSFNTVGKFARYHNWREGHSLRLSKMLPTNHLIILSRFLFILSNLLWLRIDLCKKYNITNLLEKVSKNVFADPIYEKIMECYKDLESTKIAKSCIEQIESAQKRLNGIRKE